MGPYRLEPYELGRRIAWGTVPHNYPEIWDKETVDLLQDFNRHAIIVPYEVTLRDKIVVYLWPAGFADIPDRTTERFRNLQEIAHGMLFEIQNTTRV